MKIILKRANINDCEKIHKMQKAAFADLLEKYRDYETNPASESLDVIKYKMNQPQTEYYFIVLDKIEIGVIRIVSLDSGNRRISPVSVLPEYQNSGFCQAAMKLAEEMYPNANLWLLDTIKQEKKLCCLYEKLGYVPTGKEEQIKDGMTIVYYEKRSDSAHNVTHRDIR